MLDPEKVQKTWYSVLPIVEKEVFICVYVHESCDKDHERLFLYQVDHLSIFSDKERKQ